MEVISIPYHFEVPRPLPKPLGSLSKTIRFPCPVAEAVERELWGTGSTFTAFVVAAVKLALESLEEQRKEDGC